MSAEGASRNIINSASIQVQCPLFVVLDCVPQSVTHLTQEPEVPGSIAGLATYQVSPSADSIRAIVSYG